MGKNSDDLDSLVNPNKGKHKKHNELLDRLKEIEELDADSFVQPESAVNNQSFLPSSFLSTKSKSKKSNEDENADKWFETLIQSNTPGDAKGNRRGRDLFESAGIGKKKKKKKNKEKGELTDYNKEFETEVALYRNLLQDQNRFTDSLQREYDSIKGVKSSSRGFNKALTDLVLNINGARSLAMQLVEKNVNTKKLIAELTMKEKKEMGNLLGDGDNLSDFASTYLKQMISERKNLMVNPSADISDYSEEELFESLSESLSDNDRSDDVDKYLKYENQNVSVCISMDSNNTDDYYYYAINGDGDIIHDYPLPEKTTLSINRSTSVGTDTYGSKYHIEWR